MKLTCVAKIIHGSTIVGYKLKDTNGNSIIVKSKALKEAMYKQKVEVANLILSYKNDIEEFRPEGCTVRITKIYKRDREKGKEYTRKVYNTKSIDAESLRRLHSFEETRDREFTANKNLHLNTVKYAGINTDTINQKVQKTLDMLAKVKSTYDRGVSDTKNIQQENTEIENTEIENAEIKLKEEKEQKVTAYSVGAFEASNSAEGCTLICSSDNKYKINIPNGIFKLNRDDFILTFNRDIPKYMKKLVVVGGNSLTDASSMFYKCRIGILDLSNMNTDRVNNMHSMFRECEIGRIDLSTFNTYNVVDMSRMFFRCKIKNLDLSSFNTSKVENMQSMFEGCYIEQLNLSSFNTSSVINMCSMFDSAHIKHIDLSNFNTESVCDMSYMFYDCCAEYINIKSFTLNDIADITEMFTNCTASVCIEDPELLDEYDAAMEDGV